MKIKTKTIKIKNESGLHTKPGNEFVAKVKTFSSKVEIENGIGKRTNASSLLKILSLGIKKGDDVTLYIEGDDSELAITELTYLLENLKD